MPNGAPPPPSALGLLRELRALEDAGERAPSRFGPLSAYLVTTALTGAVRAPGLGEEMVDVGRRAIAELRRAAGAALWGAVFDRLDELSELAGADADVPGVEYVQLVTSLQNGETIGERLEVSFGPWTLFRVIGLLQMSLRHPAVAEHHALGGRGEPQSPVEMIARGLCANFGGVARSLLEEGFDPANDVDADGVPVRRYGWSEHDGTMIPVGLGPDMIYDVVTVATPCCPRCGANPALALGPTQAMCANDDCDVLMWNPQDTAEEFEASAVEQVLVRGEDGVTRNMAPGDVPEGAETLTLDEYFAGTAASAPRAACSGPGVDVDQEGDEEQRGQAEQQ